MMRTIWTAGLLCVLASVRPVQAQETRLYWGDTHLHTSYSFDVYLFGTFAATPDTAYRFARGLPVVSPATQTRWQLSRSLDFLIVADHAELLGTMPKLFAGDPTFVDTEAGKLLLTLGGSKSGTELQVVYDLLASVGSGVPNSHGLSPKQAYVDLHGGEKRRSTWNEIIDAAERYNQPGVFTALIGWEWSSQPGGANIHRVVFTPQGGEVARQFLPFSALESQDPEDLWRWLAEVSGRTGADFLAIPHNANLSDGRMFPLARTNGQPVDADYARTRMKWEPVLEVTQIKGDSETHPSLSPTDEFADYETYNFVMTVERKTPEPTDADYARSGLRRGLALDAGLGVNPYKFGLIGSSDSHTGMSAVEETGFAGKSYHDAFPGTRGGPSGLGAAKGWDMGAAGFVAAWASENTRQGIFDAFQRREVYASTGPRITLRFFGGFGFDRKDLQAADRAALGYRKGVPMGGDLATDAAGRAPAFLVAAMKDPLGANLDRVQIVKGWLEPDGATHERIYDVAVSGGRTIGPDGRCLTPIGNTVDVATGKYSNDIGATELAAVWRDPDFDAKQRAFYYARVLEIPTPRYSLLDSIALGKPWEDTGRPATIQERVYGSPIWYTP
ncbi:MAG: DUF3604 domain-containing protein [Burkholderiaceae bacterium]|jgi:hypothetical protein|nr:DUF3604 domain-containing protein [Burkholderiaceae bacterium]